MEHLDFILWVCLFPLSINITDYYGAKYRNEKKQPHKVYSNETETSTSAILVIVWVWIAILLF